MSGEALARSAAIATIRLKFLDIRIDILTNDLHVAARLKAYFQQYLFAGDETAARVVTAVCGEPSYDSRRMKPWERPTQPDRTPKECFYDTSDGRLILKNRTGVLIALSEDGAIITGDLERHLPQVVNLVGTLFGIALLDQGYAMLHASAVVVAGADNAIIFTGNSGSGKSSLALQLIEHGGYDFLTNDRVLLKAVRGQVRIVGLPKKPRVNPGTLLASTSLAKLISAERRPSYERMNAADLWRLEEKTDVDVRANLGAGERLDGVLNQAFSLEWRPSGTGLTVEQLDVAGSLTAMGATRKDFGAFDLKRESRDMDREFRRIARACPFVSVSGRADPKGFAARLVQSDVPAAINGRVDLR